MNKSALITSKNRFKKEAHMRPAVSVTASYSHQLSNTMGHSRDILPTCEQHIIIKVLTYRDISILDTIVLTYDTRKGVPITERDVVKRYA